MTRTNKHQRTSSARRILGRITGADPALRESIEAHKLDSSVAEMILAAREKAGLTQTQLAKAVGTTQSVISRLEDADYEGHSLSMLRRIAEALNQRVEVRLVAASWTGRRASKRA
ncbi:MAG: helix-turn-helix transcriptional regulator [Planctomycetota bacterium]